MSGFLGFDPNDPLANKPNGAQGGLTWQALGGMPEQMWDGMNVWDKISLGTGLAAPFAAPFPPVAAGLAGISATTGLLGAGQSVYEDPSAFNIGANLVGVTPWGKLADKMGIFHPPKNYSMKTEVENLEAAGKTKDEIWQETNATYGSPMYRDQTGMIKQATSDAKANFRKAPQTVAEMRADLFPEGSQGPVIDTGNYYQFDHDGNPIANTHGAAWTDGVTGQSFTGMGNSADEAIDDLVTQRWNATYGNKFINWDNPRSQVGRHVRLADIFEHDELANNLNPHILDRFTVKIVDNSDPAARGYRGSLNPSTNEISLNVDNLDNDINKMRSTLLHELQHGVQENYNMQPGYNVTAAERNVAEANKLYDAVKMEQAANQGRRKDFFENAGYNETRALANTAFKLKEMDRLKGYLDDYRRNGSNLTNKRRNIFNSGGSIMDHNDEYEMRIRTITTPKWKKPAQRNPDYEQYIENVLEAVGKDLDPDLVAQVRNSGVKDPHAKFNRKITKIRNDYDAQYKAQEDQLSAERWGLRDIKDAWPPTIYAGTLGEAEARLVQEWMDLQNLGGVTPWNSKTFKEFRNKFLETDGRGNLTNVPGMQPGSMARGLLSSP